MHVEIDHYPEPLQRLLGPLDDLVFDFAGKTDSSHRLAIAQTSSEELFPDAIRNSQMADCCLAGLWLLHGFLDKSHEISQSTHTAEGSYWHAIMHRAERDFWNSKYWYRKVGAHSVLESLGEKGIQGEQLVDLCEQASEQDEYWQRANELAKFEWSSLFHYCWTHATTPPN